MTTYRARRTQWLYCQRTLREMLARAKPIDVAEIRGSIKRNQRFMSFERRIRDAAAKVPHAIH